MLPKTALFALSLLVATSFASAQSTTDDTSKQLDPSATCPYQVNDQIVQCLATVESDEATRAGGPCSSGDWKCICNKQQGLIDCYLPCAGTQPAEDVQYNKDNCAGQHGVTNKAAGGDLTYEGSPLTTSGGSAPSSTNASSPTSSSTTTTTTTSNSSSNSTAASSPTSSTNTTAAPSSSSSSGASSSSTASNGTSASTSASTPSSSGSQDDSNAAPVVLPFDKAAVTLAFGVVACLALVL